MCIIIDKDKGVKYPPPEVLSECWWHHDDGAGFMFFDESGKLVIKKGFMKEKDLMEALKPYEDLRVTIHFRNASPGMEINAENTHPFYCAGDTFTTSDGKPKFHFSLVHNGRLHWIHTKDKSDTACFWEMVLAPILDQNPWFLDSQAGVDMLYLAIRPQFTSDKPNKFVIFRHEEEAAEGTDPNTTYIFGKKEGLIEHGCWFSNDSFKKFEKWTAITNSEHQVKHVTHQGKIKVDAGYQVTEQYYRKYCTEDDKGWKWSNLYDCWLNDKMKLWSDWLTYRQPPYLPEKMDHRNLDRPAGYKELGPVIALPGPSEDRHDPDSQDLLDATLDHLENTEKGTLCREAGWYLEETGVSKKDIKKMGTAEKIGHLREGCAIFLDEVKEIKGVMMVDIKIIEIIKAGGFRAKMKAALDVHTALGYNN